MTATPLAVAHTVTSIPSALSVANAFLEAFNHGDLGALRSIYSDDIVVSFGRVFWWGSPSNLTGPEEVLESDREHIDLHAHYTLSNVRAEGNRVTSQFSYMDEELELFNFFPLSGSLEFTVEDGRITTIEQKLDERRNSEFAEPVLVMARICLVGAPSLVRAACPKRGPFGTAILGVTEAATQAAPLSQRDGADT